MKNWLGMAWLLLFVSAAKTGAHPLIENALDVVISPDRVVIDARIAREEINLVQGVEKPSAQAFAKLAREHAGYVGKHLGILADEVPATLKLAELSAEPGPTGLVAYRVEFSLATRPKSVQIQQSFLREFSGWSASCILRVRTSDRADFDSGLLTGSIGYDCAWGEKAASRPAAATSQSAPPGSTTRVEIGSTLWAYFKHGFIHILEGFDHLLFVSALTLAARSFWDLFRVVTAFTIAHTVTLTLSVLNIFTLSEHIVEPMIAASIVFVAFQNIFWPRQSRGFSRLAIAFSFGLFHGLGFAGGLKEAMSAMPPQALWAALIAFSIGVEIGHQTVILPLYAIMRAVRMGQFRRPGIDPIRTLTRYASAAISIAGLYFFYAAIRG